MPKKRKQYPAEYRRQIVDLVRSGRSPEAVATPAGGVQAEWTLGTREVSLEVNLQTRQAEWYWLDVSSNDEEERMLDLDSRSSWTWLCDRVTSRAPYSPPSFVTVSSFKNWSKKSSMSVSILRRLALP